MEVLGRFGEPETEAFFEELGIVLKDRNGYLYPASGQASSVLDALREELSRLGVNIVTECGEAEVAAPGSGKGENQEWTVLCKKGRFCSDALILAAGSKAAPSTGSDGSGYDTLIVSLPFSRLSELFFRQRPHLGLNLLDGAHGSIFRAMDGGPAQMHRAVLGGTAAAGQIFDVLFVDVLPALVAVVAAGHELLAHGGVYL